jgi:hypothetical protein
MMVPSVQFNLRAQAFDNGYPFFAQPVRHDDLYRMT